MKLKGHLVALLAIASLQVSSGYGYVPNHKKANESALSSGCLQAQTC